MKTWSFHRRRQRLWFDRPYDTGILMLMNDSSPDNLWELIVGTHYNIVASSLWLSETIWLKVNQRTKIQWKMRFELLVHARIPFYYHLKLFWKEKLQLQKRRIRTRRPRRRWKKCNGEKDLTLLPKGKWFGKDLKSL